MSLCDNRVVRVIPRSPAAAGRRGILHCIENTRSEIPRCALSKATPTTSFPRKRESTASGVDPRFRGGDEGLLFEWVGSKPMTTRNDIRP
jgi:hypothetical protein